MPSQDSKPAAKRVSDDDEEDDKVSLGFILKQKNGGRSPIGANQAANVKKGEPSNGGGSNSSEKKPIRKVKRQVKDEEGLDDEDDDDLPIGKRASFASNDKAKWKKETNAEDEDDDVPIRKKVTSVKNDKVNKETKVKDEDEDIPLGKKATSVKNVKGLNKKKVKEETVKKTAIKPVENGTKKRERKVYDLPGQKRDPPEERDPLRIFYESLYEQIPDSEMAQLWMMESGLLSKEVAKKVFEKKKKKGSPAKSAASMNGRARSPVSTTVKKNILKTEVNVLAKPVNKQKDLSDNDSDDDFILAKMPNKKKTEVKVSAKPVYKRKDLSDDDSDDDFVLAKMPKRQRAA